MLGGGAHSLADTDDSDSPSPVDPPTEKTQSESITASATHEDREDKRTGQIEAIADQIWQSARSLDDFAPLTELGTWQDGHDAYYNAWLVTDCQWVVGSDELIDWVRGVFIGEVGRRTGWWIMHNTKMPGHLPGESNTDWCIRAAASIPAEEIVKDLMRYIQHELRRKKLPLWSHVGAATSHGSGVASAIVCRFMPELGDG